MKDLSLKYMFKGAEWSTLNLPIRSTMIFLTIKYQNPILLAN